MKKQKKPISRSENMRRIKSKETSIEVKLRKVLWARGHRYRKNCPKIKGKPDICFIGKKVAIFTDSEYWHGKYLLDGKYIPKTNPEYWIPKIKRNMERDKEVNAFLKEQGWTVLRFWQKEIENELENCILTIENALESTKNNKMK